MRSYETYNPQIDDRNQDYDDVVISSGGKGRNKTVGGDAKGTSGRGKQKTPKPAAQRQTKPAPTRNKWFTAQHYRDMAQNKTLRYIVGLALGCFGVWMVIAFVSYFTHCLADQSLVAGTEIGSLPKVGNTGGEAGARISDFFIDKTFGLGSIVILFWIFVMALKMFNLAPKFKTVNFTIKCFVALIAVSLLVGLTTIATDSVANWGGAHGRYVNEFIIDFIGWTGAIALSVFVLGVFVVLCLSDFIRWIMKLKKARDKRLEDARKERENAEKRQALIAEMNEKEEADAVQTGENAEAVDNTQTQQQELAFDSSEMGGVTDTPDDSYNLDVNGDDEALTPKYSPVDVVVAADVDFETLHKKAIEEAEKKKEEKNDEVMVVNHGRIVEGTGSTPALANTGDDDYIFPGTDLLIDRDRVVEIDPEEQIENKERIKKTLADFGIPILSIEATVGPTVTLYEIVPEKGVKIAKIRNLVDDIALRLSALGVRIIAPIPGRGTVGIEVANKDPQTVSMRTVIRSQAFQTSRYKLPIAMGATISNKVWIADLAKMPHLLVAGATGQGKSVGLNAIITSLLYCRRPHELKFVLIDPKMVEFSLYAKIEDHYLAKLPEEEDAIITDVSRVAATLSSLCVEMDNRYQLLKKAVARNIEEYNKKVLNLELSPDDGHRFLPYIVIIVDEFSDLIMQSGKEVEMPIARLAQKARAVGMHVIIATQRPSTDVITGLIKGNFPARIAFKVSSGVDSKTILDTTGAQQLIGRGDMLVSHNSEMTRVQCAFIDTPEVEAICRYISEQPHAAGPYILPPPIINADEPDDKAEGGFGMRDPLFEEVARSIVNSNTASTSSLQRRYSIGYNRAGKIMDQLADAGIVGPAHGGKPRAVLVDAQTLEDILNSI